MKIKPRTNLLRKLFDLNKQSIPINPYLPLPPLTVLYGSTTGSSSDYANQVGVRAKTLGFQNVSVKTLDLFHKEVMEFHKKTIKQSRLLLQSHYNGTPSDNASKFDKWIDWMSDL